MRLSEVQKTAVREGLRSQWLGTRESGTQGSTMIALHRKGLADVQETRRPYKRLVYRLTDAGNQLRVRMALDEAIENPPRPAHTPIAVRCGFCGWEFHDGTPGGSCGRCGQAVEQIERTPS